MTYSEEKYNALLAVCNSYKNDYDSAFERLKSQQREIERLKAENEELSNVVSSKVYDIIDNTKEIADAREAWEQQAKIDVLNELWEKVKDKGVDYKIGMRALSEEIDELLKEYE